MKKVSPADFWNETFSFATAKEIEIGYAKALGLRITYGGAVCLDVGAVDRGGVHEHSFGYQGLHAHVKPSIHLRSASGRRTGTALEAM